MKLFQSVIYPFYRNTFSVIDTQLQHNVPNKSEICSGGVKKKTHKSCNLLPNRKVIGSSFFFLTTLSPQFISTRAQAPSFPADRSQIKFPVSCKGKKTRSRFKTQYTLCVSQDIMLSSNINNIMQLPVLDKIILNTSSKNFISDRKNIVLGLAALEMMSMQKPNITRAKKSIAGFKLRQNMGIGCKVTLRGLQMFSFLEKLSGIILPRTRDMVVIEKPIRDTGGNYNFSIKNCLIFPEIENHFHIFEYLPGINVTLVTKIGSINNKNNRYNKNNEWEKKTPVKLINFINKAAATGSSFSSLSINGLPDLILKKTVTLCNKKIKNLEKKKISSRAIDSKQSSLFVLSGFQFPCR